jgi:hypothetical protein
MKETNDHPHCSACRFLGEVHCVHSLIDLQLRRGSMATPQADNSDADSAGPQFWKKFPNSRKMGGPTTAENIRYLTTKMRKTTWIFSITFSE